MIILDEEPSSKASRHAGPTLRFPERAAGRSTSALTLPDYETSQALAHHDVYKNVVKTKADTRFWRAILYALLIYIALSLIIGIPIVVTKLKQRSYRKYGTPPSPTPPWQAGFEVSGPNCSMNLDDLFGAARICNSGASVGKDSSGKFLASSQHSISPYGEISIRANVSVESDGPSMVLGKLTVGMNPNKTARDALLSLDMQASSSTLRNDTNICFSMNDDACDLALYVPGKLSGSDSLQFNITLWFPHASQPSAVDRLSTWLPGFTQSFDNMDKQWTFGKVTIEGPSSKVDVGYLQANDLHIQTSSAGIRGQFQVNQSMTLDTVDAPIEADIILMNDWKMQTPTYLTLDTGNGDINAKIHLNAPRPPRHHSAFFTSMKTFNGQIKASITHDNSTPSAELQLRTTNYLAETHVTLDSKYEGTFNLQTKLAKASVKEGDGNKTVTDPSGEQRKRRYQFDHLSSTQIFGWIGSGSRPGPTTQPNQGHVEIVSSHSSVMLELDGAGNKVS